MNWHSVLLSSECGILHKASQSNHLPPSNSNKVSEQGCLGGCVWTTLIRRRQQLHHLTWDRQLRDGADTWMTDTLSFPLLSTKQEAGDHLF